MENKYIIECRYECWTANGKGYCPWYIWQSKPMSEEDANNYIKEYKKTYKFIDDKTKLKHEYRLKDYNEYIKECKALEKTNEKNKKAQEAYLKSDEYKELQKKKRQSAKERKERQKKYLEEHNK